MPKKVSVWALALSLELACLPAILAAESKSLPPPHPAPLRLVLPKIDKPLGEAILNNEMSLKRHELPEGLGQAHKALTGLIALAKSPLQGRTEKEQTQIYAAQAVLAFILDRDLAEAHKKAVSDHTGESIFNRFHRLAFEFGKHPQLNSALAEARAVLVTLGKSYESPAPPPSETAVRTWRSVETQLLSATDSIDSPEPLEFRSRTADLLRRRPDIDLRQALAAGLAGVHGFSLQQLEAAYFALNGSPARKGLSREPAYALQAAGGGLRAATRNGYAKRREGFWFDADYQPEGRVNHHALIDGKPYFATEAGAFILGKGGLTKVSGRPAYQAAEAGGRVYFASAEGLLGQGSPDWTFDWRPHPVYKAVRRLFVDRNQVLAATDNGLYRGHLEAAPVGFLAGMFGSVKPKLIKWNASPELSREVSPMGPFREGEAQGKRPAIFHWVGVIDERLYAAGEAGLFMRDGHEWKQLWDHGARLALKLGYQLHVLTDTGGLYARKWEWSDWEWVHQKHEEVGFIHDVLRYGLVTYLATQMGIRPILDLPENWETTLLEDLKTLG